MIESNEKVNLTKIEKKAIQSLKKIAKNFPPTLWLFSASSKLCVMKYNKNGEQGMTKCGYIDGNFKVDEIDILNDGGDW